MPCSQCLSVWVCVCLCLFLLHSLVFLNVNVITARNWCPHYNCSSGCCIFNFFLSQIGRRTFKIYSVGKWVVLHASTCTDSHSANDIGYWNLKLEILLLDAQFRASVSLFHVVVCFSFFLSFSVHINVFVVQFFMLINYRMVEHNTIEW